MTTEATRKKAWIFHGYAASPEDHWFPWLAKELDAAGIPTTIPALPAAEDPDPVRWVDAVRATVGQPDEDSIIVAHSLGCLTVLRHLSTLSGPWRLGALVLVSGFVDRLPALPSLDSYIESGCDVQGLGDHVGRLTLIRSDEDPFVPTGHTDRLARLLGTSARVVPGAGHFLASEGITSLREVLDAVTP
ncbi:RBBP9/YdeN family alpha/beta hydrolase [Microtetraspora malaysiensis]|uniref:RBBP9/YdeN family alpha/beta hydrolase n=1 Tax=Microtetraspora malaysiensis TaxID=161358 RepID=UPI0008327EEB|nr:alpha/beta hydrolase [Microtetraspora malaysiensis]